MNCKEAAYAEQTAEDETQRDTVSGSYHSVPYPRRSPFFNRQISANVVSPSSPSYIFDAAIFRRRFKIFFLGLTQIATLDDV